MSLNPLPRESTSARFSLDFSEFGETPKILSTKEIVAKDAPSPWVITKTVKTIQIQTQDIKVVKAFVDEFLILHPSSQLEEEFNERADRWARETGIHSSPVIRFMHRDYQSIMARGEDVIPVILNRMKKQPDDWFWALEHIANFNAASGVDGFDGAVDAWLKWGVANGYISE